MSAIVVPFEALKAQGRGSVEQLGEKPDEQFRAYLGCLMTTGYALSGSLLAPNGEDAPGYLAHFIDDPLLLARVASHVRRQKLSKFLLAYVLLEQARMALWDEAEELLNASESDGAI